MATSKKTQLKDYIDTVSRIKPSAEVKFASVQEDGSVDELSARQQYWESMTSDEVQQVAEELEQAITEGKKHPSTGDLLSKIDEISKDRPEPEIVREIKDVVTKVNELSEAQVNEEFTKLTGEPVEEDTKEVVEEGMEPVRPEQMVADEDNLGPVAGHYEELEDEDGREERQEVSTDVSLILMTLEKLIDKIDNMQNFTPVIHVPAPVIHVTLPETRRTVTKAVERDEQGYIKTVTENIEDVPQGEPIIEVMGGKEAEAEVVAEAEEKKTPKRRQRKKKEDD